jgi:hypothetical protein
LRGDLFTQAPLDPGMPPGAGSSVLKEVLILPSEMVKNWHFTMKKLGFNYEKLGFNMIQP